MSNPAGYEGFVDLIYQAAIDSELWPTVLDRLVELIDGEAATLHWYDLFSGASNGVGVRVDQTALDKGFEAFSSCSPLTEKDPAKKRHRLRNYVPRIRRDVDWLPKDQFIRTAYYNDFFQAFGFHSDVTLGLMVEEVGGGAFEGAGLNVFRHKRHGDWSDDNMALCAALHPHLIRSYRMGRRVAAQQRLGDGLMQYIDQAPWGMFILDAFGRINHANETGQALLAEPGGLTVAGGRLSARRSDDTRRLLQLIGRAGSPDREQRTGGSMTLTTPGRRRPLSILVCPMRGDRASVYPGASAVMACVMDPDASVTLPEKELQDLFGLTLAETKVALALGEGLDPAEVARRLGLSLATVRTHLAHIFDKTETRGQVALSSLLTRLATAAPAARSAPRSQANRQGDSPAGQM
jgi:DNA-binding CsgD family transcriptional regulator